MRFRREASLLSRLSHPNIVRVHNFGRSGGEFFIVMELLKGMHLGKALAGGRQFDLVETAVVLAQILSGLTEIQSASPTLKARRN